MIHIDVGAQWFGAYQRLYHDLVDLSTINSHYLCISVWMYRVVLNIFIAFRLLYLTPQLFCPHLFVNTLIKTTLQYYQNDIYGQMLTILADKMGCFNQIATEKYILYENQKTAFVWRYLEPKILSPCELQLTMWMSSQRHFHVEKVSIKLQLILLEHAYRCVK